MQGDRSTIAPIVLHAPHPDSGDPDWSPFVLPGGTDGVQLQGLINQVSTQLVQWLETASQRPPLPGLVVVPAVAPDQHGLSARQLLRDLNLVMAGSFNTNHPGALAHLDPPACTASIIGELACAVLNNNLLAEELSPLLSRLERTLMGWCARRIGLGPSAGGVLASGGSLSNLAALVVARRAAGLTYDPDARVLASEAAHVSIDKAMAVMGLHPGQRERIPCDASGRMDADALAAALARGGPTIAVVATAGTTVRGAIDPLVEIASHCARRGVWLHVDAAIGGVCALGERHRQRLQGLHQADSVTINPQKWLGITKASSMLLLRQPGLLAEAFAGPLPYMEPASDGVHGGDSGLQGTRPAEVLKLWLGLRQLGIVGIDRLITAALDRAALLRRQLEPLPLVLPSGDLHLVCFRPEAASHDQHASWSLRTRQRLLGEGLMLSRPQLDGCFHLKAVLGNPHTGAHHLRHLADLVAASLNGAA